MTAIFNRTIEFRTFVARTTIIWTIRHGFVPTLDAEQVIITGAHYLESVAFDTVGAANFIIHGSDLLTAVVRSVPCSLGREERYRTVWGWSPGALPCLCYSRA